MLARLPSRPTWRLQPGLGRAIYQHGQITLDANPAAWFGSPAMMHHEFGHHVHVTMNRINHGQVDPALTTAMAADRAAWERRMRQLHGPEWTSAVPAGVLDPARASDQASFMQRHNLPAATPDTWRVIGEYYDTVGGLTRGHRGFGHSVAEYDDRDGYGGAQEVFANLYSAQRQGHEAVAREFPKTWKYIERLAHQGV